MSKWPRLVFPYMFIASTYNLAYGNNMYCNDFLGRHFIFDTVRLYTNQLNFENNILIIK